MYVGKVLGKTVRLSNKDYESLKKKWHPSNITQESDSFYVDGHCSLCDKFLSTSRFCPTCPLSVFSTQTVGCLELFITLFPRAIFNMGVFGTNFKVKEPTVKKYMQKLQDILNTFEKEKSKKNKGKLEATNS